MAGISGLGYGMAAGTGAEYTSRTQMVQAVKAGDTAGINPAQLKGLKRSGAVECATCASRQYQDGSDENNVSFKSAAHIDPAASRGKVMSHEAEHVANAFSKAAKNGGSVINASVSLKTAICPECGRSYVAGGVTNTTIRYDEKNPYGSNRKSQDREATTGKNVDYVV